jgi:hypothetical protein
MSELNLLFIFSLSIVQGNGNCFDIAVGRNWRDRTDNAIGKKKANPKNLAHCIEN